MRKLLSLVFATLAACSSSDFSIARTPEEHALETSTDTDRELDSAFEGSTTDSDRKLDTAPNTDAASSTSVTPDAPDASSDTSTRTVHAFPALVAGVLPTLACAGNTSTTTVLRAAPVRRIELLIRWWYKATCTEKHQAEVSINGTRLATTEILPALGGETTAHLLDLNVDILPIDGKYSIDVKLLDHVDRECSSSAPKPCGTSSGALIRIADGSYLVLE